MFEHDTTLFPGDPTIDESRPGGGFDIPRSKASAGFESGAWNSALHAQLLDRLPNYDEEACGATSFVVNGTPVYKWNDGRSTYYDISRFDAVDRTCDLEFNDTFGAQ